MTPNAEMTTPATADAGIFRIRHCGYYAECGIATTGILPSLPL
jgi:hypothetical protein